MQAAATAGGGRPGEQQPYYMAPPPGYYPYAPPPPAREEASSGTPWFIWVGVGMVGALILTKARTMNGLITLPPFKMLLPCCPQVQEFMKNPKTPQQMMTEMVRDASCGGKAWGKSLFTLRPVSYCIADDEAGHECDAVKGRVRAK